MPRFLFRLLIITLATLSLAAISGCKKTQQTSETKDLQDLAAGKKTRRTPCENKNIDANSLPFAQGDFVTVDPSLKQNEKNFKDALFTALTSIPKAYQEVMTEMIVFFIGNAAIHKECLTQGEKNQSLNLESSPKACWYVDDRGSREGSQGNLRDQVIVSFYPKDTLDIQDEAVRIFGAALHSMYVKQLGEFFRNYSEAVLQAFLYDAAGQYQNFSNYILPGSHVPRLIQNEYDTKVKPAIDEMLKSEKNLSPYEGIAGILLDTTAGEVPPDLLYQLDFKNEPDSRGAFEAFTFSHAFESWYCNEGSKDSTKDIMAEKFPVSYALFNMMEPKILNATQKLVSEAAGKQPQDASLGLWWRRRFFDGRGWWLGKAFTTGVHNTMGWITQGAPNGWWGNRRSRTYHRSRFRRASNNAHRGVSNRSWSNSPTKGVPSRRVSNHRFAPPGNCGRV